MHSCSSSQACCLQSTSKGVCGKKHDAHCPDCELHDKSICLSPQECSTVIADKDFEERLYNAHSSRVLSDWAKHIRIKNYKRLSKERLVQNIAKALSGDKSVLSTKRGRSSPKLNTRRSKRNKPSNESKFVSSKVRAGYRPCICGTEECKTARNTYSRTRECVSFSSKKAACDPSTCIIMKTTCTLSSAVNPVSEVIAPLGARDVLPVSGSRNRPHNPSMRVFRSLFMVGVRQPCTPHRK